MPGVGVDLGEQRGQQSEAQGERSHDRRRILVCMLRGVEGTPGKAIISSIESMTSLFIGVYTYGEMERARRAPTMTVSVHPYSPECVDGK